MVLRLQPALTLSSSAAPPHLPCQPAPWPILMAYLAQTFIPERSELLPNYTFLRLRLLHKSFTVLVGQGRTRRPPSRSPGFHTHSSHYIKASLCLPADQCLLVRRFPFSPAALGSGVPSVLVQLLVQWHPCCGSYQECTHCEDQDLQLCRAQTVRDGSGQSPVAYCKRW